MKQLIQGVFEENKVDSFAIFQLKENSETMNFRFEGSEYHERKGIEIDINNYDIIYTDKIPDNLKLHNDINNYLFDKFNVDRPHDFTGHSLSVSDVIALKIDSNITYHFVDRFGFKEVPFVNHLINAEMQIEANLNNIDGIINNEDIEKKPSILKALKEVSNTNVNVEKQTEKKTNQQDR